MPDAGPSTPRRSPRKTKAKIVTIDTEDDVAVEENVVEDGSDSDDESMIQIQLKAFIRNIKGLEANLKKMQKENENLKRQLDIYKEGAPTTPRRRAAANVEHQIRMQELEGKVEKLLEKNKGLHKRIKKLERDQLKAEADELNQDVADGAGDPDGFTNMRKLLKRFCDMMSITTLVDQDEPDKQGKDTCPICLERIVRTKGYAMPCEHLVCVECLPNISKGADETVKCPMCRQDHQREDLELLRYSETERWDELLKIANAHSSIDYHGGTTTSEEEEEDFINDEGDEESRTEGSDRNEADAQDEDEEADGEQDGEDGDEVKKEEPVSPRLTPERPVSDLYANSPTKEKRKRLQDLMRSKNAKRRRV
ncbi:hypothetical protein NP233_g7082 [Leucocoprinus birnbaumii]|uniref:RING-type domain-containing protein n=1 Tax=Leucocoprinus birnbaumii TaxID=56174 RepID=A0AAD5VQ05_9AGAR|nr:hypothetical protein NP233_g7082 [Leucocoprinus birnbaumii]